MVEQAHKGQSESDPLDILIVGGGPAGTAAAFRATELKHSVLVIDRDNVLSILRDFVEQDKMVDADYEDCAGLPFPTGGDLVEQLRYSDQTPAQVLFERWMGIYEQGIPFRNSTELVSIERRPDGLLSAMFQDETSQGTVFCKTVVLAIGRGSNPKLELMGDAKGIRYRLRKPTDFVGAPACVIGGGMSAAEAVVALSVAKAKAEDASPVFWCNRRRNLPKVAKGVALANRFYEAWTTGNIEYLPTSKPIAVIKAGDGSELLAVRVTRRIADDRPPELVCYEFAKKQVLACIGSDRPDVFLSSLGIELFEAADSPKPKKLAVTRILESQVPGVFIAGSVLDPRYIEATDFAPDTLQNTVKPHPGCFKTSVTDGVLTVEAIHSLLSGNRDVESIGASLTQLKGQYDTDAGSMVVPPAAAPVEVAPESEVQPDAETEFGASFVHLTQKKEQGRYVFSPGVVLIGRSSGNLTFPSDRYLVDNHGALRVDPEECYATNQGCAGETYVGIDAERTVGVGTILTAGGQQFRVDLVDGRLALAHLDGKGQVARHLPVHQEMTTYGRNELDPNDKFLSKTHFDIAAKGDVVLVRDCSRNGFYVQVNGALVLNEGDEVCMGDQRFRFLGMTADAPGAATPASAAAAAPASEPAAPTAAPETAAASEPAALAEPAGEPVVVLQAGVEVPIDTELPALSVLFQEGFASDDEDEIEDACQTLFECWDPNDPLTSGGNCGKCVVTVGQGAEMIEPASSKERNTIAKKSLKKFKGLDGSKCRLACKMMLRGGPVHIEQSGGA
jgi:thioredoxin reductase